MIKFMDDTVAAIAWANGFQSTLYVVLFVAVILSEDFRSKYEIFDFSWYKGGAQRTPLLSAVDRETGEDEPEEEPATIKQMSKVSMLLFARNFFSTLASITGSILLSARLSTTQFVANNVLSNTVEFSSFATYFNTVLNIFGPRFVATGNKEKYQLLFKRSHIFTLMMGAASYIGYFAFNTGWISLDNLTTDENKHQVEEYLAPIWPIWLANEMFSMWANLYDTTMINFQKYHVLGILGTVNAVFIAIPISLISVLKYHSLIGIPLSILVSNVVEVLVTAYLFHFKYYNDPSWEENAQLEPISATTAIISDGKIND
jgi:hypothetical protein